jgi:cell wall-associated NlpC family hydrolase
VSRGTTRRAPGRYAIVSQAALDLRRGPDHREELRSQLLLGETVQVLRAGKVGGWLEVRGTGDGYQGWVRSWGLVPTTLAGTRRWRSRATARVSALFVEARSRPAGGWLVTPLFWATRVVPGPLRGPSRAVRLPDGRTAWVPVRSLARARRPTLERRVQELLGVPYLWGGRTPAGLDCSAFAQLLLGEQGVELPRDTAEQIEAVAALGPRARPRSGDLIFFRARSGRVGHVGVGLGNGYFAHCRGTVRISTLEPLNPLYDSDLSGTEVGWFRPRTGSDSKARVGPSRG